MTGTGSLLMTLAPSFYFEEAMVWTQTLYPARGLGRCNPSHPKLGMPF